MRKGTFEESSGFTKICMLIMFFFCGSAISIIPFTLLDIVNNDVQSATSIRITIFIQDIFIFIIPPLITQYFLWQGSTKEILNFRRPSLPNILWGIVAIVSIGPLIDYIGVWNQGIHLPQSMQHIEQWIINAERSAEIMLDRILNTSSWGGFISNIFLIAVMAGISEEILFRGVLQKIFIDWTRSIHLGIIITAIIFSAIHFQFFGFFPRVILGVILGYLYIYSRSLWIPIIAHTVNNGLTIIFTPTSFTKGNHIIESFANIENNGWFITIGLFIFSISIWQLKRRYNIIK